MNDDRRRGYAGAGVGRGYTDDQYLDRVVCDGGVMRELAYHKRKDGSTLTISVSKDHKFEVAVYSRSDIEQWSDMFDSEVDAWEAYRRMKDD